MKNINEQQNTKEVDKIDRFLNIAIVTVILAILAVSTFGIYVYAKYRETLPGTGTAQVAKWYFDLKNGAGQSAQSGEISFPITRTDGHTEVAEGKLAPGTFGEFELVVDTRTTEVDLIYELKMEFTHCPANLKFYRDSARVVEFEKEHNSQTGIDTIMYKKYLTKTQAYNYLKTIKIYWEWPYESDGEGMDAQDTNDSQYDMVMNVTATATEVLGEPVGMVDYLDLNEGSGYKVTVGTGKTVPVAINTGFSSFENITYTSDNTSIATIDTTNGLQVTGVSVGNTTITMTGATSGKTQKIYVTVEQSEEKVGTWTLSSTNVNVNQGDTATVNITTVGTDPLEASTFEYSPSGVATASLTNKTITITGVSEGTTTITIRGTNSNQTKTINVTVVNPIKTVTLDNQSATTAGTTTIYETYGTKFSLTSDGTAMTTSTNPITVPTKTDYVFKGYYTQTNGGGMQYINANGYLTSSASNTNFSSDGTLYAYWTELSASGTVLDTNNQKVVITKSNVADYLGKQVSYSPTGGGTWRIFYIDFDGKYEDANSNVRGRIYLKRDHQYNLNRRLSSFYSSYTPTYKDSAPKNMMVKMNPKWAAGRKNDVGKSTWESNGETWNDNEKSSAYLCDITQWTSYVTTGAEYAIGSPSVDMYVDSVEQKYGNLNTYKLNFIYASSNTPGYKFQSTDSGASGGYYWYADSNSVPDTTMYRGSGNWWLASPSAYDVLSVCKVAEYDSRVYADYYGNTLCLHPLVSLSSNIQIQLAE